jgi:mycoredoxin
MAEGPTRAQPPEGTLMSNSITMYSTPWCGYCRRLKGQLERAGISYSEVDIEQHPDAADLVAKVNNGNQTVPTVVFPDGSALTNPSIAQVADRLGVPV